MGDGNVGIQEWARQYAELCPGKPFTLEIITWIPPRVLNYLEDEYWEIYRSSARFSRPSPATAMVS